MDGVPWIGRGGPYSTYSGLIILSMLGPSGKLLGVQLQKERAGQVE